jgi:hypothetical protein
MFEHIRLTRSVRATLLILVMTAVLALVLTTSPAGASTRGPGTLAHMNVPAGELSPGDEFTDPITGILPICPAGYGDDANYDPLTNPAPEDGFNDLGAQALFGLGYNCANQDWDEMGNAGTDFTKEATGSASPDIVPISDHTTQVTFTVGAGDMPGPYNGDLMTCFPTASFAGGCSTATQTSDAPDPNTTTSFDLLAVRSANDAGQFVGQWTLLDSSNNPWFDFTKSSGCENNYGNWSSGYWDLGFPCTYTLKFATDVNGLPTLTKSLEVDIGFELDSGTETATFEGQQLSGWQWSSSIAIPMLFEAGASTKLTLAASPLKLTYGKSVSLTANAAGPGKGTPISFLGDPAGSTSFSAVGSGSTNASGDASATVKPSKTTVYEAKITGTGVGASVTSAPVTVTVSPKLSLNGRVSGSKGTFTGTVAPDTPVLLQQFKRGKWKTVARLTPSSKGAIKSTRALPKGHTVWRLSTVASPALAQALSGSVSMNRR